MEDFFRFGVGIEKKNFEKFSSVHQESSRELSLKSRVKTFGYFTEFTGNLPGKFQADGYIFQGVLAILKVNF